MRYWVTLGIAAMLLLAGTRTARAVTTMAPHTNDDYFVFVGMVGLCTTCFKSPVVCWEKKSDRSSGHHHTLGGAGVGLDDDYNVYGDATLTSGGSDDMRVDWPSNLPSNSYCKGLVKNGTGDLVYNGHYLDLYGGDGNDSFIWDGGGSHDTFVNGGTGHDFLEQSSSIGRAKGNDGNDTLWGLDGSADSLRGDSGADCLWDANNSFAVFDCGGDTGDSRDPSNTGTTGCPNTYSCGFT